MKTIVTKKIILENCIEGGVESFALSGKGVALAVLDWSLLHSALIQTLYISDLQSIDKRVGTNSDLRCFPTQATETISGLFPTPTPLTMLSPCNKNDVWISTLSGREGWGW